MRHYIKVPKPAAVARARALSVNAPPIGSRRGGRTGTKGTTQLRGGAQLRLSEPEFADEPLKLDPLNKQRVWCIVCRHNVGTKKTTLQTHLASAKHKKNKTATAQNDKKAEDMKEHLETLNNEVHLEGETLPLQQQAWWGGAS